MSESEYIISSLCFRNVKVVESGEKCDSSLGDVNDRARVEELSNRPRGLVLGAIFYINFPVNLKSGPFKKLGATGNQII